jgi:hypothetical protein
MKTALLLLLVSTTIACQSRQTLPQAESPTVEAPITQATDSPSEQGHVELGMVMYEISKRFAHLWYAGEAGNGELAKYQVHEIEEIIEDLEKAGVTESKIVVGPEFAKTVLPHLEEAEKAALGGNTEEFRKAYNAAMTSCNSCHVQTGHPYLLIDIPTHNPYVNIKVTR